MKSELTTAMAQTETNLNFEIGRNSKNWMTLER